jgi:succinylarginine dihydrolase
MPIAKLKVLLLRDHYINGGGGYCIVTLRQLRRAERIQSSIALTPAFDE